MVRIGAAIAVVVLAILLGLTVVSSFGPSDVIVPTGGVTDAGPQDDLASGEEARQALAERSRLQGYRGDAGPSPDGRVSEPATGQELPQGETEATPGALVERWQSDETRHWQLLRDRGYIQGISPTIPDPRADVLQQPQGRDWRRLHNEEITYGGGWVIFGFSLLLALFLLLRGRIPLEKGFSGIKVPRFDSFERANHWFTASSFVMLALTGLILLYGQFFLKGWMGAGPYSWLAQASVYVHVALSLIHI